MLKKAFILMTGMFIIATMQANAMMDGHGSSRRGSGSYYGYGYNRMGNTIGTGSYYSWHNGNWGFMPWNGYMGMGRIAPGRMLRQYTQNYYTGGWLFGRQRNYQAYYMPDLIGSNGIIIYRFPFIKRNNTVTFWQNRIANTEVR